MAHSALDAIALHGEDVIDQPVSWQHDGFVLSIMTLLSDKINNCSAGSTENYSEVYCLCVLLLRSFLNADFDKAFQTVHDNIMSRLGGRGESIYDEATGSQKYRDYKSPDLSDCLYE